MGIRKTGKPIFSKEFIWPAEMIHIATDTLRPLAAFPRDAAQATSDPAIKHRKHPLMANHPVSVRFTFTVMADRLVPLLRPVWTQMVSLSFFKLFLRGQRVPRSNGIRGSQIPAPEGWYLQRGYSPDARPAPFPQSVIVPGAGHCLLPIRHDT